MTDIQAELSRRLWALREWVSQHEVILDSEDMIEDARAVVSELNRLIEAACKQQP